MIPSVVIATPFYQSQCFTNYLNSLLVTVRVLDKLGVENDHMALVGDSYIDRARNTIVARFLYDPLYAKYDRLFFIDSDMRWDTTGFIKVLSSPYDFTGAAYPMKNRWGDFSVRHLVNDDRTPVVTADGYIESVLVPGGFMCLSRACLQDLCSHYKDMVYRDTNSGYDGMVVNLFENKVVNNGRMGEDSSFCVKWSNMGRKIYCWPDVDMGHMGVKEWSGNYHETLLSQPRPGE